MLSTEILHNKTPVGWRLPLHLSVVARSGRFRAGKLVTKFEGQLADYLGLPHTNVVFCSSGSSAAIMALGELSGPKSRVLIPAFNCPSVATAARWLGRNVSFVDSQELSPLADAPIFGVSKFDINVITPLLGLVPAGEVSASLLGLWDLSHALTPDVVRYAQAKSLSGFYAFASTGATKLFSSGGGGVIFSNDDAFTKELRHRMRYEFANQGTYPNFEPSELFATIGLDTLKHQNTRLARREALLMKYESLDVPLLGGRHDVHSYAMRAPFRAVVWTSRQERILEELTNRRIGAIAPYTPDELWVRRKSHPNAVSWAGSTVSLPLHAKLNAGQVKRVAESLREGGMYFAG